MQGKALNHEKVIELDGSYVISWLERAGEIDRQLMIGASYADDESEWRIEQCDPKRLFVRAHPFRDSHPLLPRHLDFFSSGTFFFDCSTGEQIQRLAQESLTPAESKIIRAKEFLSSKNFHLRDFGGDSPMLQMYEVIQAWDDKQYIPEGQAMLEIYEIFKKTTELQRQGVRYLSAWMETKECNGVYEPYLRWGLATLLRHTGQADKALTITEVVELPNSRFPFSGEIVAKLCTVRAGVLCDLAEKATERRAHYVRSARLTANKANANSKGDSTYVREVYRRIKQLDDEDRHATAMTKESEAWSKIGCPPAQQTARTVIDAGSREEQLRELKRLYDAGLISQEIYLERQRKLLE